MCPSAVRCTCTDVLTTGCSPRILQGDTIVVPRGWNLVIDVSTPQLAELWIDGGNVTVATSGVVIYTGYLIVRNGGVFAAGTEDEPFTGNLAILLHGRRDSEVKPWSRTVTIGAKAVAVVDGRLSLHAAPRARAVPLAADAASGATTLELSDDPEGWAKGDTILVTSTDWKPDPEEFRVESVTGRTVTLAGALARAHTARRWIDPRGTHSVDMRARVLNLASNIVIAADDGLEQHAGGDPDAGGKFGAHVLAADKGLAQLDGVAVRYCGQYGEQRGCMKFQAPAAGSYLRNGATAYGATHSTATLFMGVA